jgi:hypothetical protein
VLVHKEALEVVEGVGYEPVGLVAPLLLLLRLGLFDLALRAVGELDGPGR